MIKILEKILRIVGLFCLIYSLTLLLQRYNPNRLDFTVYSTEKHASSVQSQYPSVLKIKSAAIEVPILPARIQNGHWETTDKGVSYLATSPLPGEKGNSIIYGHNWSNILGSLSEVKTNDIIEIEYKNLEKKHFIVQYIAEVSPDQTHVLTTSSDHRLTVYTCSGFLDMKRLVIVAIEKGNEI